MSGFAKGMMFILVIMYAASPVDLCPGPIDDLILIALSLASSKGSSYID